MKVLIVNPIIYTSETADIKRASSIKDTMIYDLCLAFMGLGDEVTLVAGEPFRPETDEDYPFEVIWAECKATKICKPNVLPYCPEIKSLVKNRDFDLIISSEVFSLNSFMLTRICKSNLIIWHELAKHNRIMKQLPSKIWYGLVARLFFGRVPVVPRSNEAKRFISRYCKNVKDTVIDHGVNLEKFEACDTKDNYFIVSSQLIERKQIDKIIKSFYEFSKSNEDYRLYIFGEGDREQELKSLTDSLKMNEKVKFFGKVPHSELKEYLKKARALLIYTKQDNNMVSVVESIACGTPVITTSVPYNASYIKAERLGIVNDVWNENDLKEICDSSDYYIRNCLDYRSSLSTEKKAKQFKNIKG